MNVAWNLIFLVGVALASSDEVDSLKVRSAGRHFSRRSVPVAQVAPDVNQEFLMQHDEFTQALKNVEALKKVCHPRDTSCNKTPTVSTPDQARSRSDVVDEIHVQHPDDPIHVDAEVPVILAENHAVEDHQAIPEMMEINEQEMSRDEEVEKSEAKIHHNQSHAEVDHGQMRGLEEGHMDNISHDEMNLQAKNNDLGGRTGVDANHMAGENVSMESQANATFSYGNETLEHSMGQVNTSLGQNNQLNANSSSSRHHNFTHDANTTNEELLDPAANLDDLSPESTLPSKPTIPPPASTETPRKSSQDRADVKEIVIDPSETTAKQPEKKSSFGSSIIAFFSRFGA